MPATSLLIGSGFSQFRYTAAVASGTAKGELRLKTLTNDPIVIDFGRRSYRIDHERTRDGVIVSDFRFSLVDGNGGTLAFADKADGRRDYVVNLRGCLLYTSRCV